MHHRPSLLRRLVNRLLADELTCYQVTVLDHRDGQLAVVSRYDVPRGD